MRLSPLKFLAVLLLLAAALPLSAADVGNLVSRAESELSKGHDLKARYLAKQVLDKEPDNRRAKAVLQALDTEGEGEEAPPTELEAKAVPAGPELENAAKEAEAALDKAIAEAEAEAAKAEEAEPGRSVLERVTDYLGRIFTYESGLNADQTRLLRRVLALLSLVGGIVGLVLYWGRIQTLASFGMDLNGYWGLPLAGRYPFLRFSSKVASVFARFWLHLVLPLGLVLLPVVALLWAPTFAIGLKLLVLGALGGVLGCLVLALSHGVWGDLLTMAVKAAEKPDPPAEPAQD